MPAPSPRTARLVQIATCLGFFVVLMDVSVVNVALQALRTAFDAQVTDLQWIINAYGLVFSSLLLMAGTLGDRMGAKRVFMLGYAVFTLASLGCGTAQSLEALMVWRLAQGLGAALLVPTSLALLQQLFTDSAARQRAVGWWGAGGGIALAAGPVIGGMLIASLGWRSLFFINVPIGLIGLWITARHAPPSTPQRHRSMDLPGQVTGALALAALTFALTQASQLGWASPMILATGLGCIGLGALFVWLQANNPTAMLPLTLFHDPTVRSATVIGLIANLAFYGMVFTLSLYFQSMRHLSAEATGLAFLPMMGVLMVMNIVAGRLLGRVGARALATSGLLVSALGYGLMIPALPAQSTWLLMVPMVLAGSGIALTLPTITNAALSAVAGTHAGIASGLLNSARQVGGIIGVAVFGYLVRDTQPNAFMPGLNLALLASALLLMVAAGMAFTGLRPLERALPIKEAC
ncbi:major facilitator transporter [Pseudomonas sp. M47T1]|uniref:MFS transporter n=1 Tax=unclassified Pseudomonas TaxID=196821 RepID=UPI0002607B33|nr:MFS transporter [Pseudomonas sp. M47T1]EIK96224.1 major facilitator transporter [Pseudomonas sp. M47T1]